MRLERRERLVVGASAAIAVVALLVAFVVLPLGARWSAREALIAARRTELARLRAIAGSDSLLREALVEREGLVAAAPRRVLTARTPALASATLQEALRRYADAAPLAIASLDVSTDPDSAAGGVLPASISALGDVHAVAAFLDELRRGPLVVEVRALQLRPNSALVGQPLQIALTLVAPFLLQEGR